MADVNVRMGVSGISQFKQGMRDAQASVKTFDSVLKNNEKQLRNTGDAEKFMQAQTEALNGKLAAQQRVAKNAQQALKTMQAQGVDPASKSFQDMQRAMIDAMNGALDTENELNNLGKSAEQAGTQVNSLEKGLNGIGKKLSLGQVISGIDKITGGLENAARKAVDLGEKLWSTIMDSARRADDNATMAEMYGIPLERYMQMQKLYENGLDTSVESMLGAMDKVNRSVGKESTETMNYLRQLGLVTTQTIDTGFGKVEQEARLFSSSTDLFWKAGAALMDMGEAFDKEAAASAIFGRSWKELVPLFNSYKNIEEYNAALAEQTVNTEDTIRNLAELNDAVGKLESSWTTLKDEVLGALAPALTKGAEAISGLLDNLTKYLQTEDGQKMLEQLGTAVSGLFEDIGKIDPQEVVSGFVGVFEQVTGGLQWIVDNKDTVFGALKWIIAAWGGLELVGGALQVLELVQGIKGLKGGTAAAAAAGEAAGSAWGGGFAAAVLKAAPWVIGLVNLLTPTPTGNDDLYDPSGAMTDIGFQNMYARIGDDPIKRMSIMQLANIYGIDRTLQMMRDPKAAAFIDKWLNNGGITYTSAENTAEQMLAGYGYKPTGARYNLDDAQMQFIWGALGIGGDFNAQMADWLGRNGVGKTFAANAMAGLSGLFGGEKALEIPAVVATETIVGSINAAISAYGTAHIPAELDFGGASFGTGPSSGSVGKGDVHVYDSYRMAGGRRGFANGLPYVPFDGYAAILHKGERVTPAREVNSSRNYSSNLYVESMIMNNGTDAAGLAAAMAAAQRRTMSGYGS